MAFSLDDMLDRMGLGGKPRGRECYREELASIKKASREEIATMFPNVTLSDSKEIVYAPFRLCHSLPKVNLRGRCFTPKTLANSFASVRDGLVNVDHQMSYRKSDGGDTICGHMVCGRFDPYNQFKDEIASLTKLPEEPIPLAALAAFYLRSQYVPKFLDEHLSGTRKWMTSMECAHNWDDAAFFYRGEVVPIKDAEHGMRECVEKLSVKPFKGHALALALGGADGHVDFHAAALTPNPADDDAKITAFITKDEYMEAANSGVEIKRTNLFFFPLETRTYNNESESVEEETSTDELANISILGQTDACEDGHCHDVLSDLTVMPYAGHDHSMNSMMISKGTNPRLTGRTGGHYQYTRRPDGESQSTVHMHTFNISLRGKSKATPAPETEEASSLPVITDPLVPVSFSEFPMDELFKKMLAVLSAGKFEGATATEVANLKVELQKTGQDAHLKQLVKTEIANQVAAGELVTKDDHQKKLEEALKEATEKAETEKKATEARTARREKVLGLGFELDAKFNEENDMTVGQFVDSFALDDSGEKSFKVALATMEYAKKATAAPAATTETQAANNGKPAVKPGEKKDEQANNGKKPPMLLVAGRAGEEQGSEGEKKSDKKFGRFAFSS